MTDNRTTELLPCPFCGGEVKLTTYRDEGWEIKCENHDWPNATWERPLKASDIAADVGMYSWGLGEDAKAALIAAWNARAERTCEYLGYDDGIDEGLDGEWYSYAPPSHDLSCGHSVYGVETPNYCPNCGAKVVGE